MDIVLQRVLNHLPWRVSSTAWDEDYHAALSRTLASILFVVSGLVQCLILLFPANPDMNQPGLLLVGLYAAFMIFKAITDPKSCPATPVPEDEKQHLGREVVTALIPPLLLIVAVLGSILGGIATPTEAASVGSVGAMLLALIRRRIDLSILRQAVVSTATITSSCACSSRVSA